MFIFKLCARFQCFLIGSVIVNGQINGYVCIVLFIIQQMTVIVAMLGLNTQIFKFIAQKLVFWWKLLNTCVVNICIAIISSHNHNDYWNLENTTITQCYVIAILNGLVALTAVICISSIQAFINSTKHAKIVSNLIILLPIVWSIGNFISYFTNQNNEYVINISIGHESTIKLSLRTVIMGKSIDLSIFFLSQLYTNTISGLKGIQVTGYVSKKWKRINKYSDVSDTSIQLL